MPLVLWFLCATAVHGVQLPFTSCELSSNMNANTYPAGNAIDDDKDTAIHTKCFDNGENWVRLGFGGPARVSSIALYPTHVTNYHNYLRLNNTRIYVVAGNGTEVECGIYLYMDTYPYNPRPAMVNITCGEAARRTTATEVVMRQRLVNAKIYQCIHVYEVEAFGVPFRPVSTGKLHRIGNQLHLSVITIITFSPLSPHLSPPATKQYAT